MRFSCRQPRSIDGSTRSGIFAVVCYFVQVLEFLEITFLEISEVIFGSAQFLTRMPRPDRMEFDRKG